MHSGGKGIAASALPYKRTPPSWLKTTTAQVEEQVNKLAKRGLTPSQIGVILRDSHGIAQVKSVTGNKIVRILKKSGRCFNKEVPRLSLMCLCRIKLRSCSCHP
jgi:small subunit ribosomal protein S13e